MVQGEIDGILPCHKLETFWTNPNLEMWREVTQSKTQRLQLLFCFYYALQPLFTMATLSSPSTIREASSSRSNVSYEKYAPRSSAQVARLSRLAALTAGPIPSSSSDDNAYDPPRILAKAMAPPSVDADTVISGSAAFTNSQVVDETLQASLQTAQRLTTRLKHTTSLRLALRASINIAEDISNRHADLIRHSSELSAAADRLQEEEQMLARHAEEIGKPLQHYDAVDRIGIQVGVLFKGKTIVRGLAKIKVDNEEFPKVLDEIDQAVDYFGRECGGREALEQEIKRRAKDKSSQLLSGSIEYYRRSLALQEAALFLIKEAVAERISNTTQQVQSVVKEPVLADQLEASLIYTRFHGISSRSNRLLSLVKSRIYHGDAYMELLHHCRATYCNSRELLLRNTVRAHMDDLKAQHGLIGMTRLASVFLIRLCTVETSLYLDFFGEKKEDKSGELVSNDDGAYRDSEFQSFLTSLCSNLHKTIRRGLVSLNDLDTLCQIVSVLREERTMANSSPTTAAAARSITSVVHDAQERLIYCANTTITKEVVRFKARPADLDYPDKLKRLGENADEDTDRLEMIYETWFPPIRTVLKILSKIFRVVETTVFEDIALQSVQACTRSLKEGAKYIHARKGEMHSDLFLVKHLLILREQLSPFDIELRSIERQLDFSEAGKAVARFLANRNRRLFSMSTENALVAMLRDGVSVQESSVDSKRDLEDALRTACNDFIDHTSKLVAGDILAIVGRCSSGEKKENLLQATAVLEVLTKTADGCEGSITSVVEDMTLYLDNPATQSILLKPVSKQIVKSLDQLKKLVSECGDNAGWDTERREDFEALVTKIENVVKKSSKISK